MTATRAVLIDLDGTLVDSAPDIAAAVNGMLHEWGRPALPLDTVKGFIGNGVPTLLRRVLACSAIDDCAHDGAHDGAYESALRAFERHYAATNGVSGRVYAGVPEGLRALRAAGLLLGCVTNKPGAATDALLARCDLTPFFDVVVAGDSTAFMKPHPAPLLYACRRLGVAPARCVLVGDSTVDVAAAGAAGMPVYIVRYGYPGPGGHARMTGAILIDSLAEMAPLLEP